MALELLYFSNNNDERFSIQVSTAADSSRKRTYSATCSFNSQSLRWGTRSTRVGLLFSYSDYNLKMPFLLALPPDWTETKQSLNKAISRHFDPLEAILFSISLLLLWMALV